MPSNLAGSALLIALLGLPHPGCDASSPHQGEPDEQEPGRGGKTDGFEVPEVPAPGSAHAHAVLQVANTASEAILDDEVDLDRRAAAAIVASRSGPDGTDGTADDEPFTDFDGLDAVSFVGPSALVKLLAFAQAEGVTARFLRVATFNIRWYGLGGSFFGSFGTEQRSDEIRDFIVSNLSTADVLVFQEIVDLDLFFAEVAFDLDCISYAPIAGKHQHVVVCHTGRVGIDPEADDTDFGFEPLRLSNLRPGVHGVVFDEASGLPIAHLMGVHLKAREPETATRLEQAEILRDRIDALAALGDDIPVVVIGDFNTHQTDVTDLAKDDEVLIDGILNSGAQSMERAPLPGEFTFRHKNGTAFRLDQAWSTPEVEPIDVEIAGPCNLDPLIDQAAIEAHFDNVSDHCPVAITFGRE